MKVAKAAETVIESGERRGKVGLAVMIVSWVNWVSRRTLLLGCNVLPNRSSRPLAGLKCSEIACSRVDSVRSLLLRSLHLPS